MTPEQVNIYHQRVTGRDLHAEGCVGPGISPEIAPLLRGLADSAAGRVRAFDLDRLFQDDKES